MDPKPPDNPDGSKRESRRGFGTALHPQADALLKQMEADGVPDVSVMGYQGWHDNALDRWQEEITPAIARALEEQDADGVVLAPV